MVIMADGHHQLNEAHNQALGTRMRLPDLGKKIKLKELEARNHCNWLVTLQLCFNYTWLYLFPLLS